MHDSRFRITIMQRSITSIYFKIIRYKAVNIACYTTRCELSKVMCMNTTLRLDHEGPCEKDKLDQELVLNMTCGDILHMECVNFDDGDTLCGSDGRTYSNV